MRWIVIFFTCISFCAVAQEQEQIFVWGNAGAGFGSQYNNHGTLSAGFGLNLRKEKWGGSFRATYNQPFVIFTTPEGSNSYALMAGYYAERPFASFWFGAGIGAVQYFTRDGRKPGNSFLGQYYYLREDWTPSLPLDIQWHWGASRFFGAGIRAYADLNVKRSVGGVLLDLRFGYMRRKED